jgi:hypothetical protein
VVAHLEQVIEEQAELDELARRLAEYERPKPSAMPAIY